MEKNQVISALASRIFEAMLDDVIMDVTLQSHHEVLKSRAVCHVCKTRCGLIHASASQATFSLPERQHSRSGTPSATNNTPGTDAGVPNGKSDGNVYFDCSNCKRQIASNRYAPHLSGCMGLGTGSRRGAARGANAKPKQPSEAGRSDSPNSRSDNGNASDDSRKPIKGKGKSKSKRADEAEFNLKRKRPASPQVSPAKKQKKQKTTGSPVLRVKAEPDSTSASTPHLGPPTGAKSKVPSKLRANSTASFIEPSSSPSSRSSSPETPAPSISTPTSTLSAKSPSLMSGVGRGRKKKDAIVNGGAKAKVRVINDIPPPKPPSPPRPPPPQINRIDTPYLSDVEGDETGSSTDTDSS